MSTDPLAVLLWVTALAIPLALLWRTDEDEDLGEIIAAYLPYWPPIAMA